MANGLRQEPCECLRGHLAGSHGEKIVEMPAIRAVMRSHLRDALKGNGPSQRAVLG